MPRYSVEPKAAVLSKLLPPLNRSVPDVAREEGMCEGTLYNWRNTARDEGAPVPGSGKKCDNWSAQAKFAVVITYGADNLWQPMWSDSIVNDNQRPLCDS